jgi:hypothetical protein
MVPVGTLDAEQAWLFERQLRAVQGVAEASINLEDGIAYLKVDSRQLDSDELERLCRTVCEPEESTKVI